MSNPTLKAIRCKIYKGAFSGERYFEFPLADGQKYESLAPRYHMWDAEGKKIDEYQPSGNEPIDGFIAAKTVDIIDPIQSVVFLPDGENVAVETKDLIDRPKEKEIASHVSV